MNTVWRLAALLVWLLSASSGALSAASTVEVHRLQSAVLGRTLAFTVYRPATTTSAARLPVLYLLHGAGGDEHSWVRQGRLQEVADRLIASGEIGPMIIVMPGVGDCWWVDAAPCNLEAALREELEPAVAARGDVLQGRKGRAIAGASAGGHGALRLALKSPERFAAVVLMSPAVYAEAPPVYSKARQSPVFARSGGEFDAALWSAHNYPALLPAYAAGSARLPVHIAAGDRDEYGITFEAALLHRRLQSVQPDAVELRIGDGKHDWAYWSSALADGLRFVDRHWVSSRQRPEAAPAPRLAPTVVKAAPPLYGRQ